LHRDVFGHSEALHQSEVGRAAPHEDVLAVVDIEIAVPERVRQPAKSRLGFEQRHTTATVGELKGGRDAGEAATDDRNVRGHRADPISDDTATRVFCQPESDRRRSRINAGSLWMRSSSRW